MPTPECGSGLLRTHCRRCGADVIVEKSEPLPVSFPFCSDRCRLIDLGKWFDDEYRVSRGVHEADLDQPD